jgi:hypothetical protein
MGGAVDLQPIADQDLRTRLETMTTTFLREGGDVDITITNAWHDRVESSPKAEIYWIEFGCADGANIVEITLFANGSHSIAET